MAFLTRTLVIGFVVQVAVLTIIFLAVPEWMEDFKGAMGL